MGAERTFPKSPQVKELPRQKKNTHQGSAPMSRTKTQQRVKLLFILGRSDRVLELVSSVVTQGVQALHCQRTTWEVRGGSWR